MEKKKVVEYVDMQYLSHLVFVSRSICVCVCVCLIEYMCMGLCFRGPNYFTLVLHLQSGIDRNRRHISFFASLLDFRQRCGVGISSGYSLKGPALFSPRFLLKDRDLACT